MDGKIALLDHGFIRLVDHMGSDVDISRCARISHNAEWRAGKDKGSDEKLIKYLYANGHNTPFEGVVVKFEVKAPIFVIRQWHRHRTWSYNEVSARYTELPEEFYVPKAEHIGTQNVGNKQMRDIGYEELSNTEKMALGQLRSRMVNSNKQSFATYRELLDVGVPRELARSVLPVSTYTHMFATVNLSNLFKFLGERMHPHAQYEIQVYARAMLDLIAPIVPVAVDAFMERQPGFESK